MPTAFIDLPTKVEPPRKLWTRAEHEQLSGEVVNWERLELVEGS